MSVDYSVYVGVYVVVSKQLLDRHVLDDFDELVTEARGELGIDEPNWHIVPNFRKAGQRQAVFDKWLTDS